jgi:hypothetical protein
LSSARPTSTQEFKAPEYLAFVSTKFHPEMSCVTRAKKSGNARCKNNFFRGDKPGNNGDNQRESCRMMSSPRYCLCRFRKIVREIDP